MSSTFSPFEGASAVFCQRCQRLLSPPAMQCGYCGCDNTCGEPNNPAGGIWPSSQVSYNGYCQQPGSISNHTSNLQSGPISFSQSPQAFLPPSFASQPYYGAVPHDGPAHGFLPELSSPAQALAYSPSVMVEPRALNVKKVVGLVIVLLILISGSLTGYALLHLQQGGKQMRRVTHGYPIPKGSPLFAETFMNNDQHWDMQSLQGRYLVSLKKGNLLLEDDDNKLFPILLPGGKHFDNFKFFVNAELSKGDRQNGYGLCLRGTTDLAGNLTSYYRIELYGNGTYAIFKVVTDANGNTSATTLVEITANAAIKPVGQSNQIVVIANGPKITLNVNGQMVQTFSDPSYVSGALALFVSNLPDAHAGVQTIFSNLAIYPVDAK